MILLCLSLTFSNLLEAATAREAATSPRLKKQEYLGNYNILSRNSTVFTNQSIAERENHDLNPKRSAKSP